LKLPESESREIPALLRLCGAIRGFGTKVFPIRRSAAMLRVTDGYTTRAPDNHDDARPEDPPLAGL
jgi:hypothetical protein